MNERTLSTHMFYQQNCFSHWFQFFSSHMFGIICFLQSKICGTFVIILNEYYAHIDSLTCG